MDVDNLKDIWKELDNRLERLESDNARMARELVAGRATTAQRELARSYRITALVGLLLPIGAPLLVSMLDIPVWFAVLYGLFGILATVANYMFSRYVVSRNYMSMPMLDALTHALRIRRWRMRLYFVSLTLGLLVIVGLMYELNLTQSIPAIYGAVVGLVLGIIIGIRKFLHQSAMTRKIIDELRSGLPDKI